MTYATKGFIIQKIKKGCNVVVLNFKQFMMVLNFQMLNY